MTIYKFKKNIKSSDSTFPTLLDKHYKEFDIPYIKKLNWKSAMKLKVKKFMLTLRI